MSKNTSVTLGPHFEKFIRKQVGGGRFETASEVIRAGLRLLEEDESKIAVLRVALRQGETSGVAEDHSLEGVMADARKRVRAKNGPR